MSRPDKEAEWADGLVPAHIFLLGWALSLKKITACLDFFLKFHVWQLKKMFIN